MPTFFERLKSTFATLARRLTPEDEELETNLSDAETRLGLRLPSVFRSFWDLLDRPGLSDKSPVTCCSADRDIPQTIGYTRGRGGGRRGAISSRKTAISRGASMPRRT